MPQKQKMTVSPTKNELISNLLRVLVYRKNERNFWGNYGIINNNVDTAIKCFYTYMEVNKYASEDNDSFKKLNQHPTFWNTTLYSLQTAFFMSLGKIFDDGIDTLSIHKLLKDCVDHPEYFSKKALSSRKLEIGQSPIVVAKCVKSTFEPTASDLRVLKKCLSPYRKKFESNYKDIRNLVFGHIIISDKTEINKLFSKTDISEIERILHFLQDLLNNIWQLYQNGTKPSFGSAKSNYKDSIKATTRAFIDTIKQN